GSKMAAVNGIDPRVAENGPVPGESRLDQDWLTLTQGLDIVYGMRENMNFERFMQFYTTVHNYCSGVGSEHSNGADLIGGDLYERLEAYISRHVVDKMNTIKHLRGEELLHFYYAEWDSFQFSSRTMSGMFDYLNRHWIQNKKNKDKSNVHNINTLTLLKWRELLFMGLQEYLTPALLELIQRDRDGIKISTSIIRGIIQSYVVLGISEHEPKTKGANTSGKESILNDGLVIYREHFESSFLKRTEEYYAAEASNFLQNGSVVEYTKKVEKRFEEEQNRCETYMNGVTQTPLAKTLEKVLIQSKIEFFQGEFGELLAQHKDDDIARMYKLCERVDNGLEELRIALERHTIREGNSELDKVSEEAFSNPKTYINTILDVYKRYAKLISDAFKMDNSFFQALDKASFTFINSNSVTRKAGKFAAYKSPELLARYCDGFLRKSREQPREEELERIIEDVMTIFKYIEDKDMFSRHYSKLLSKRLIYNISASEDAENGMISKLRELCGMEYTRKLNEMIKEAKLSQGINEVFSPMCKRAEGVDFEVMLLTSCMWPTMMPLRVHLPEKLNKCHEEFKKFYNLTYSGRKLEWILSQSRGEVAAYCFKSKTYKFQMTATQIAVIDMFNRNTSFEFSFLFSSLGMDKPTLFQAVDSLVKSLLLKHSKDAIEEMYADDTVISLNEGYTNKNIRLDLTKRIKGISNRETEVERKHDDRDRNNIIKACIVRIMKTRRQITHTDLMTEVLQQLASRFKPEVQMIRICIGDLIQDEYMKRDQEQMNKYEYIA
ncbi:hypothetical protein WR25_04768, partial [Diploscapter pachys]